MMIKQFWEGRRGYGQFVRWDTVSRRSQVLEFGDGLYHYPASILQ